MGGEGGWGGSVVGRTGEVVDWRLEGEDVLYQYHGGCVPGGLFLFAAGLRAVCFKTFLACWLTSLLLSCKTGKRPLLATMYSLHACCDHQ